MEYYNYSRASETCIPSSHHFFSSSVQRSEYPYTATEYDMSASVKVQPLSMSQTKDELLKALGIGPQTYSLMAKEADVVYKELTNGRQYLKRNCTRNPPYDWSDIETYPKDQAMAKLAAGGSEHTRSYWRLGDDSRDQYRPNWIARWFLYHKFRYRDGRNRGKDVKAKRAFGINTQTHRRSSFTRPRTQLAVSTDTVSEPSSNTTPPSTSSSSSSSSGMFYDPVKGYRPKS